MDEKTKTPRRTVLEQRTMEPETLSRKPEKHDKNNQLHKKPKIRQKKRQESDNSC